MDDDGFAEIVAQAAAEGQVAEARADAEALATFYCTLKRWGVPVALCKELTTARQAGAAVEVWWSDMDDG